MATGNCFSSILVAIRSAPNLFGVVKGFAINKKGCNMRNLQIQAQSSINNSATSSENSETQSVEDHQSVVPPINRSAALIR